LDFDLPQTQEQSRPNSMVSRSDGIQEVNLNGIRVSINPFSTVPNARRNSLGMILPNFANMRPYQCIIRGVERRHESRFLLANPRVKRCVLKIAVCEGLPDFFKGWFGQQAVVPVRNRVHGSRVSHFNSHAIEASQWHQAKWIKTPL
jgi:hypothetical protein